MLTPGDRTGQFRLGTNQPVFDAKGESKITVAGEPWRFWMKLNSHGSSANGLRWGIDSNIKGYFAG